MKTIIIIIILLFTCCMVQVSFAQLIIDPLTCVPVSYNGSHIPYSNVNDHTSTVMDVDIGTVDYKYGTGGGVKHIAIDWTTLTNKNPNMSDLAIREFIINEILRSYGPGQFNVYYKEDCIKDYTCTIMLDYPNNPICCENSTDVDFIYEQTYYGSDVIDFAHPFRYFDIKKKIVCGFKCCLDSYTIISGNNSELLITRQQGQGNGISTTTCPIDNDHHCKKKVNGGREVIPCDDEGCQQWKEN